MLLSFFNSITGSYVLALLFYALIFKIVLLPFSVKQQKNQVKTAKLTPKIEIIKAKYKGRNDQRTMQKMQQEIMELQQKEGASPMSGCLPLLIQLPIIMLLYTVIQNPMSHIARTTQLVDDFNGSISHLKDSEWQEGGRYYELVEEYEDVIFPKNEDGSINYKGTKSAISKDAIILKIYNELAETPIKSLSEDNRAQFNVINSINSYVNGAESEADRNTRIAEIEALGIVYSSIPDFRLFGLDGFNLAGYPGFDSWLIIIPILAAASSWLSMWLTRKMNKTGLQGLNEQDKQTRQSMMIMDIAMPLMTLFIAFGMPGMLGVYWVYQSALGLLVSFIMMKAIPLPKYTEEDIKEIRKAQKEAEKAHREYMKNHSKHRSLHYIDEDDYDELPEVAGTNSAEKKSVGMSSDMPEIKD